MPIIKINLSQEQVLQLINGQDIIISICNGIQYDSPVATGDSEANTASGTSGMSFFLFFQEQINRQERNGCQRTLETYRAAYNKFKKFCNDKDVTFDTFDADLLEGFQSYLRHHDLSMNTISFYMRILRSVYRKSVELGITVDRQPFKHVYTGQPKTAKRAIGIDELRRIKELQIDDREVRFARDLFLFSFYTRGMSFVDIAYLQHSDVKDGILTYKRRKTGQQLTVSWEASMQEIVDEYSQSGHSPYLLPIIKKRNGKERNQYRHVQTLVNSHLKTIAQMAGINCKLTMYCARHSWASIARQLDIPMRVISRGMGHDNELTTEIYLKSVDSQSVDQANREIISLVRG